MSVFSMTRIAIFFLPLVLIPFICACETQNPAPLAPVIRPIRTLTVGEANVDMPRSFSGITAAASDTPLSFRVSGKIDSLPVVIGMKVRKGDLIATLDSTDYTLSLNQARARLAQALAQLTQARAEYDRDRQLYEAEDISRSQMDRSLALFQSSRAQVTVAEETVRLAARQLQYTKLLAPLAGAISMVPVEAHQTVAAGQPIAMLSAAGKLEMAVGIPESLIAMLHVGDTAQIVFDAFAGNVFDAVVIEVGIQATNAAVYPVRLQIQNGDERLRPGMVGESIFTFKTAKPFLTIPLEAVLSLPSGKRYVWIYREETSNVTRREISVGKLTRSGIQVVTGLSPGDIIAIRGVHRLTEGLKVTLLPDTEAVSTQGAVQ